MPTSAAAPVDSGVVSRSWPEEAAGLLLDAGLAEPAGHVVDSLLAALDPPARSSPGSARLFRLWAVVHARADLPPVAAMPSAPIPPWWTRADLARPEVQEWIRVFRGAGAENLARWRKRLVGSEAEAPVVRFHPVQVVAGGGKTMSGIEVVLPGGLRITVEPGFAPDVLIEVIEAIEGRTQC